jgi:beta-N-acetylhexosaminidase
VALGLVAALVILVACGTPQRPDPQNSATGPAGSGGSPARPRTSAIGPDSSPTPVETTSPTPAPQPPQCSDLVGRLDLDEQVGQLFMVGVPSSGLTAQIRKALSHARAGSVILLGNTAAGVRGVRDVVDDVRGSARHPGGIATMLAADQEGGLVQRLKGRGFADMPSARTQGTWQPSRLQRSARAWGKDLRDAGIDANLAPVADVVPTSMVSVNQPIGVLRRGFGSDPEVVASHVAAFVAGMNQAGVATAVKHFPGLGSVRGNTDLVTKVVDATTTRTDSDLEGFRAGAEAGVDMVMVSSAYYRKIDPKRRAAYSPTVIKGMIRSDLGFAGVVISDDLAAPGATDLPPGTRALRFLGAGGDLVIVGDPSQVSAMVSTVEKKAAADRDFRAAVSESARRVLVMKAARGLVDC